MVAAIDLFGSIIIGLLLWNWMHIEEGSLDGASKAMSGNYIPANLIRDPDLSRTQISSPHRCFPSIRPNQYRTAHAMQRASPEAVAICTRGASSVTSSG